MLYVYVKSYNLKLLDSFCQEFLNLNIPVFNFFNLRGPVFLPRKSKTFTTIRSPHVNSLSREHFTFYVYRRVFIFKPNYNFVSLDKRVNMVFHRINYILDQEETCIKDFFSFKKFLIENLPVGISLKFKIK
jgi:small subunit ribosomal protein S10